MYYHIDRIEGDFAVLEQAGETADIALSELPDGIREGDMLVHTVDGWVIDREAAEEKRRRLAERRRNMLKGRA